MNTQIYEEASEWIVLHRNNDLDADSRRRFDAWLRDSPQHVRAYLEMSSMWEDVPALDPGWNLAADELIARARADGNIVPLGASALEGLSAGSVESDEAGEDHSRHEQKRSNPGPLFSIAASLLIAVGIAAWLYLQQGTYSTGIGEQRSIALADGSSIKLNARSKISVEYTGHERAIDLLQGQAMFRVAKDPDRPFIVESNGTHIRAVGTQFDVYKKSTGTVVTVLEGRVAVLTPVPETASVSGYDTPDAGTGNTVAAESRRQKEIAEGDASPSRPDFVYVSTGEQILIAQTVPTVPKPANIEVATAWTQQRLIFDFSPLTEVADEFNRYSRRPLVIEDASLKEFNVSGSFSSIDPTLLLRFLRAQPEIAVSETANEIRISRQETGTE